jgi:hypothetical protein
LSRVTRIKKIEIDTHTREKIEIRVFVDRG